MRSTILLLLCLPGALLAQQDQDGLIAARDRVNVLARLLLPGGLREGFIMREYLVSDDFLRDTKGESDPEKMDQIYLDAMELAHWSPIPGLLGAALGTFEHKAIPLDIFGLILPIPLTVESQEQFQTRVSHLPKILYDPKINDVDKLQHFFSSAWLKAGLGMNWLVNLMGNLVEIGEDAMVEGGFVDPRDEHANGDGLEFCKHRGEHGRRLPHEYLTPNP